MEPPRFGNAARPTDRITVGYCAPVANSQASSAGRTPTTPTGPADLAHDMMAVVRKGGPMTVHRSTGVLAALAATAALLAGCSGGSTDVTPATSSGAAGLDGESVIAALAAGGVPCDPAEAIEDFDGEPLVVCNGVDGTITEGTFVVYIGRDVSTSCANTDPAEPLLDVPLVRGDDYLVAGGPLIDSGLTSTTVDFAPIAAALDGEVTTLRAVCGLEGAAP